MIPGKTLFILGAGSSIGYNYPIGKKLVKGIIDNLNNQINTLIIPILKTNSDALPNNSYYSTYKDLQIETEKFVNSLREAKPNTIDAFLSQWSPDFDKIGKFALALYFLNCEKNSATDSFKVYYDSSDNWQRYLFDEIFKGYHYSTLSNMGSFPMEYITFNYDRSLECSFYKYVKTHYREADMKDVKRLLDVVHIYGGIRLKGFENYYYDKYQNYGDDFSFEDVIKNAESLDIMYASRPHIDKKIKDYDSWIKGFNRIFFLGFGFDDFNLNILKFPEVLIKSNAKIYGTIKGLPEKQVNDIKQKIIKIYKARSRGVRDDELENSECKPFLEKHL